MRLKKYCHPLHNRIFYVVKEEPGGYSSDRKPFVITLKSSAGAALLPRALQGLPHTEPGPGCSGSPVGAVSGPEPRTGRQQKRRSGIQGWNGDMRG